MLSLRAGTLGTFYGLGVSECKNGTNMHTYSMFRNSLLNVSPIMSLKAIDPLSRISSLC